MKRPIIALSKAGKPDPYIIWASVLSIIAFVFKLYLLYKRRPYIDPDEGYYMVLARNILTGNGYALNGLPNIIFPPFLPGCIAAFYILCRDLQFSLGLVTALSGSLLGIIVFVIARRKVSPGLALLGSFLALFAYQMNAFLPVVSRYIDTLYRGSDTLNCCLIFAALYFSIRFLETGRAMKAVLAGLLLSLGYLTRPEGLLLTFFIVLSIFAARTALPAKVRIKGALSLIIAFSLFAAPYVIYLKNVTGAWTLSGKVNAAQSYRGTLLQVIDKNDWAPFRSEHYSLNSEKTEMSDTYFGYYQSALRGNAKIQAGPLKNIFTNLKHYSIVPATLFPPYLLVLALIGIIFSILRIFKYDNSVDLLLISLVPFSLAIESLSYPIPRHHLFLVPLACLYAVIGVGSLFTKLPRAKSRARTFYGGALLLVCLISIGFEYFIIFKRSYLNIPILNQAMSADVEVGRFLKAKNPGTIMSEQPGFAVRAFSDWQVLPNAALPQALMFGVHKKVDLVVVGDQTKPYYRIIDLNRSKLSTVPNVNYGYFPLEKGQYYELLEARSED